MYSAELEQIQDDEVGLKRKTENFGVFGELRVFRVFRPHPLLSTPKIGVVPRRGEGV